MKAFVTGGAGFIGSHLVNKLITRGDVVTVYDNLSSGKKQFLEQHMNNDKFRFVEADLLDLPRLKNEIKGHDAVFHIAANPFVIKHNNRIISERNIIDEFFGEPGLAFIITPPSRYITGENLT